MDRADSCRRAARDAVADVEPPRLHEVIHDTIDDASMTPGVLTLETAAAIDSSADSETISRRAAGVQLIYEGLRLTRRLTREEPWAADGTPTDDRGDLEILAADILVARGFYLLARTDAAGKAVRTVQAFGREQTRRESAEADPERPDASLERDVLELAVLTGAAAVGSTPTPDQLALAADVADAVGTGFPPPSACLPALQRADGGERRPERGETDSDEAARSRDGPRTDRATSATDP